MINFAMAGSGSDFDLLERGFVQFAACPANGNEEIPVDIDRGSHPDVRHGEAVKSLWIDSAPNPRSYVRPSQR